MDGKRIAGAAREAFAKGVNDWILRSRIRSGRLQGPNAELPPGSLGSDVSFEAAIRDAVERAGAPAEAARAIAAELYGAWKAWADGFRMSLPGAFPGLAAVPGPFAPPTPAAAPGFPLSRGHSSGEARLLAANLRARLAAAVRPAAGRDAVGVEREMDGLATWIEASFRDWKASAQILGVMGKGPVPTFAPPYVPVGPVVMGDVGTSGPTAIAGPRFGRP